MQINLHQTHHTIADFNEIFSYLKREEEKGTFENSINLFPELFLCGYPLQDLLLTKEFIRNYHIFLDDIKTWWKEKKRNNSVLLLGGLDYRIENDIPAQIKNVVLELSDHKSLEVIYTKCLLPSYDIFDEAKYYSPGKEASIWTYQDLSFGILICEDMWFSPHYDFNPVEKLHEISKDKSLNGIFNFSASPFHLGKEKSRMTRAKEISTQFSNIPFYYVNRVGSEDEIVFDGASFILKEQSISHKALSFKGDLITDDIQEAKLVDQICEENKSTYSFETLFNTQLCYDTNPPKLLKFDDDSARTTLHALHLGIMDYANKIGAKKFLVALSGGIDSALVLTLLGLFKSSDQEVEAVYMPSQFSANLSYEISKKLCDNLGIKLTTQPIKFLHSAIRNSFKENFEELDGLADENIQSRIRGALIYARSNQTGSIVINTSNKSELAVGYSTLYGDSVGAISPLGDLYKSEVFELCRYINKSYQDIIPEEVINRPPSAELREDQKDEQSLPPYEVLDAILEGYLSYKYDMKDLIDLGFNVDDVAKVVRLNNLSEYKRAQFCPIIKLKAKSFGFGRRIPITKKF